MPYNKTIWVNESAPYLDAANMNKIEQGISDARVLAEQNEAAITTLSQNIVTDLATTSAPGLMSSADKVKLDGLSENGGSTLETLTSLSLSGNILTYVDENSTSNNIDLSPYLDNTDTNTYVVSGSVSGNTLTLTMSDATTVDIALSLTDDNTHVVTGSIDTQTKIITLTKNDTTTVPVDLSTAFYNKDEVDSALTAATPTSLLDLGVTDGTAGQVLTTDGNANLTFETIAQAGAQATYSDTAPESPTSGDLWFDTSTVGELFIYDGSFWVSTLNFQEESDPVVGAITGLVKADGAGNISAAIAGTDYSTFDGAYSSLSGAPTSITDLGITDGSDGQVLTTDGAGNFSFTDAAAGINETTDIGGVLRMTPLSAEPANPAVGMIAIADGTNWDPASKETGLSYPAYYNGTSWISILPDGVAVEDGLTYLLDFIKANSGSISLQNPVTLSSEFELFIDFQRDVGFAGDTVLFGSSANGSYWVNIDSNDRLVIYFGTDCFTSGSLNTEGFLGPQINTLKITRDASWGISCTINGQTLIKNSGSDATAADEVVDFGYIGRNLNGAYYDGILRNFKIFDGGNQFTGTLILDMPLDDGPFSSTFLDRSPNENHGVSSNIIGSQLLEYQLDDAVSPNTLTDTSSGTKVFTIANT
jgi:hypothetical protein